MSRRFQPPVVGPRRLLPAILALVILCGPACQGPATAPAPAQATPRSAASPIGALGHVEAGDGLVMLGARSLSGQPSIVGTLVVKEGDAVARGQVVAELDSLGQLEATARQASARIEVARRRLAQVQAGAKPSDIAAQGEDIARLEAELANAKQEQARFAALGTNTTAAQLDALDTRVASTSHALAAARQRLASLSEVRPVDVEVARADLAEAVSNEQRALAERKAAVVRSPIDGRVVKVHARAGEQVQVGILELAPTAPMYVVAEVAESDILRVKVGQRATITADGLAAPVQGVVERLGTTVLQNELRRVDPALYSDGRVVKVWIRLDNGAAVANLIHLRVNVVVTP